MRDKNMLQEVELGKDRMTIGRKPHNDIVIAHSAVSAEHALLTQNVDGVFLEDLGSTNGTYINGERIAKRMLEDHDVIVVAKFQIEFIAGPRRVPVEAVTGELPMVATIEVKSGANAGKKLVLTKPISTMGKPGVQVIAITREANAYFCAHVDGHRQPLLNGRPMERTAQRLTHGDAIEVAGGSMVFCLTPA
jgi:pSer/pThr/pTyr-binding forkhead associated (FHA) protein